ncbi:hypothetical protein ET006_05530 [Lactococcus garvieae]|nr:hypothetical protein [Lactococcus garvieae]UKS68460.1 hypothetical protein G8766_04415 [Lactococcus garvieae]
MWNDIKITDIISAGVSIVAIGLSFWAIWQTKKQIELSNKQQLFEKRLRAYLEIEKMVITYKNFNDYNFVLPNIEDESPYLTIMGVYPSSVAAQFNQIYYDIEEVNFSEVKNNIMELHFIYKEFRFLFSNELIILEKFMEKYINFLSKVVDYQESVIYTKDIDKEKAKIVGTVEAILVNSEHEKRFSLRRAMEEVSDAYESLLIDDFFSVLRNEIKIINNKKSH